MRTNCAHALHDRTCEIEINEVGALAKGDKQRPSIFRTAGKPGLVCMRQEDETRQGNSVVKEGVSLAPSAVLSEHTSSLDEES